VKKENVAVKDEFALIRSLLQKRPLFHHASIEVDVGDDAAVVCVEGAPSMIFTVDTMVETVHFLRRTLRPEDIGWKLLASNLSDIHAMGGVPKYALLSLGVSERWTEQELEQIYEGFYQCARESRVTLLGGDTVRSPKQLVLSLTLIGEVRKGQALLRSAARPGDVVFVTGTLGDSAAGLELLLHHPQLCSAFPSLIAAHRRPHSPAPVGVWLAESGFRPACDDISDGLSEEAWAIAEASGVQLVIERERIPLSPMIRECGQKLGKDPFDWALHGGEDYELIGTISEAGWEKLCVEAEQRGWKVTPIGWVEDGGPDVQLTESGKRSKMPRSGYHHTFNG